MDVQRLMWPDEAGRREGLRAARLPRILVVGSLEALPVVSDPLEDWVWGTATEIEVTARAATLRSRAAELIRPELDADGVLRYAGCWTTLPPVEARLCRALVDRFGVVVGRDEIAVAAWPDGAPGRNALDVHMLRLRRRVITVGLTVRTVRSRGFLLDQISPSRTEQSHISHGMDSDQ